MMDMIMGAAVGQGVGQATGPMAGQLNGLLVAMILALLIPIYEACKDNDIWQKMLAFASVSTKTSMMILVVSVLRDDWMIGLVGVLILSVGNAALMLLAHLLRRTSSPRAPQQNRLRKRETTHRPEVKE